MGRYDGLIIPRSYSEYINKTDAATLQQALQLSGVLSGAVAAGDNKAVKSSAVNNALADYAKKISLSFGQNSSSVRYFKISGLIVAQRNGVYTYQSRDGELYLISVGHGDSSALARPHIKKLFSGLSKVKEFRYLGGDLFISVDRYAHEQIFVLISGTNNAELSYTESNADEWATATPITLE